MSAAALMLVEPTGDLSPGDRARIMDEQRECNLRAIRLHARECPSPVIASPMLVRYIEYWEGDASAIRRGQLALTQLSVLIEHAPLSEIAADYARACIEDARAALARFETPWGPSA